MGAHRNSGQTTDEIGKEQEKEKKKHTRLRSQHSLSPLELLEPRVLEALLRFVLRLLALALA